MAQLTPEQMASDIDRKAEQITTSSPEAYKYYLGWGTEGAGLCR